MEQTKKPKSITIKDIPVKRSVMLKKPEEPQTILPI